MKRYLSFLSIIIFLFLSLAPHNYANASDLSVRLKGKILLQVESNGEAWYVNPNDLKRYYLGRPSDAFNVMRGLGVGISNKDFDYFKNAPRKDLIGKILIKVEDLGKAYYVNPTNLKFYFLGSPSDAFTVMRILGTGIKNIDLIEIETGQISSSKSTQDNNNSKFSLTSSYLAARVVYLHCLQIDGDNNYLRSLYDKSVYNPNIEGSGVIISSSGELVTNSHVVGISSMCLVQLAKAPNYSVPSPQYYAKVIMKNENADIAKLKIYEAVSGSLPSTFSYFQVNTNPIEIGTKIYISGFPYAGNGRLTLTEGIISGKNDLSGFISGIFLITSAKIDSGNSGGAAITADGKLIGLPTYVQGNYDTLGYILDLSKVNY